MGGICHSSKNQAIQTSDFEKDLFLQNNIIEKK